MVIDEAEADVEGVEPVEQGARVSARRARTRWRWVVWSLVAAAAAGAVVVLTLYWEERTLRAAQRELEEGDPRRALALVSYFLDAHPEHGAAAALKARALTVIGESRAAIELYEQVGAATVADLHAWAQAYLMEQSWSRALALLTQVVRREPDNADALHEITGCRVRLGLLAEALESARRLSELPDQQAKGLVFQAAIYNDMGRGEESLPVYQQVVELVPNGQGLQIPPDELFTQYGMVLLDQGRTDAAIEWLKRSLASRPTAAAYYYLGNAHSRAGKSSAAEEAWQKSLQLDPGGVPVHEALATSALQRGDTEAALKWLRPLERLAETRFKTAYLFQRVCLKRKDQAGAQRWQKKVEELRKRDQHFERVEHLMRSSPYSFWANVARARRFAAQGNWRQAGDMIQELARESPQDPFVQELTAAIRQRGPLPPLERIPIQQ